MRKFDCHRWFHYFFQRFLLTSLLVFSLGFESAQASSGMWGTGMYPATGACQYNPQLSDEVVGIKEQQEENKEQWEETRSRLRRAKARLKRAQRELDQTKADFQKRGLSGAAYNLIDRHISSGTSCATYESDDCPARKGRSRVPGQREGRAAEYTVEDPIESLLAMSGVYDSENETNQPLRNVASNNAPPGEIDDRANELFDRYPARPPTQPVAQPRAPSEVAPPARATQPPPQDSPLVSDEPFCESNPRSSAPFAAEVWGDACSGSTINGSICRQGVDQGPGFNGSACSDLIKKWYQRKAAVDEAQNEVAQAELERDSIKAEKSELSESLREAKREAREEYRRTVSEGGCVGCMVQNSSRYQQARTPNWLDVGGNLLLGLGSMYFGQQQQRYISDNNAKLGFPTQTYPAIGYGFPYFGNALYGALGGGMSQGGFGCGTGFGNGGGGGGGAFGYPGGMGGNPMGGGMFNGGFGPGALGFGQNGGMMNGGFAMPGFGMGNFMPGAAMPGGYMQNAYMMPGGNAMGGFPMSGGMFAQGGIGFPMAGGNMMGGFPMSGGFPMNGGFPMTGGMFAQGGIGFPMGGGGYMMGGYPMGGGYMMGGGMPMTGGYPMGGGYAISGGIGFPMGGGNMMGGYAMPGGFSMPGGYQMVGGMPMGGPMPGGFQMAGMMPGSMMSMMPGMGGGMMGGMDPASMQMQQMQMQLQMQQAQTAMQMQQRRMENYMAQSRVVQGLSMELNTLYTRLQQAQLSMQSGGSFGFESGGAGYSGFGFATPGSGYSPIYNGTGIGGPVPGGIRPTVR